MLELLIVIAIVGIIASVLLVAFKGAMERARIAQGWQFSDSLRGALQMDMVAWWTFDRIYAGTPPTTPDSWFDRKDGTIYGNVQVVEGIVNNALEFDGDGDYVNIPNIASFSALTVTSWFKNISGTEGVIMSQLTRPCGSFIIYSGTDTLAQLCYTGSVHRIVYSGINTMDSQWHFGAVTFDGTYQRFYLDGKLMGTSDAVPGGSTVSFNQNQKIGSYLATALWFNGLIDEVQIYNAALPQAVIQQHYVQGLKRHQDLVIK